MICAFLEDWNVVEFYSSMENTQEGFPVRIVVGYAERDVVLFRFRGRVYFDRDGNILRQEYWIDPDVGTEARI